MEELKRQIRNLDSTQLAELRRYIDGLGQFSAPGKKQQEQSWIEQTFLYECNKLIATGAIHHSLPEKIRKIVNSHSEAIENYIARSCPGATLTSKRAILATGLVLLYDDLVRKGIAASATALANNLSRLPAVIDLSFPGYAQIGILGRIIKKI